MSRRCSVLRLSRAEARGSLDAIALSRTSGRFPLSNLARRAARVRRDLDLDLDLNAAVGSEDPDGVKYRVIAPLFACSGLLED